MHIPLLYYILPRENAFRKSRAALIKKGNDLKQKYNAEVFIAIRYNNKTYIYNSRYDLESSLTNSSVSEIDLLITLL